MYRKNLVKHSAMFLLSAFILSGTLPAQSYKGHSSTFTLIEKITVTVSLMTMSQDYLYTTNFDGLINVFDIRSPGAIVSAGDHRTIDIMDMDIEDSLLCVASRDSGLIIFDVSDPQNFIRTGKVHLPGYTRTIEVNGNYAYLSSESARFNVIDISDPYDPVLTGTAGIARHTWSMDARGDYVYCGVSSYGLQIVDVSDPYVPVITGSYNIEEPFRPSSTIVSGKYVYMYDNYSLFTINSILRIYDIEDTAFPLLISETTIKNIGIDTEMALKNNYIFIPGVAYGMHVYNVADPASPVLQENYNFPIGPIKALINGGYMYVSIPFALYVCSNSLLTGIENNNINFIKPSSYVLAQNYPNPFNPVTTIKYELPKTEYVTLTVYNIMGQVVTKLVDRTVEAGYHEAVWDASKLASGVYIYKLTAGNFTSVKRMMLVK